MQLVLYMNAAVQMEQEKHPDKQVIPAGLLYYRMKDPIVDKPGEDQVIDDIILQELKPDGIVQKSEEVLRHFDREFVGSSQVIPVGRTKSGELSKTSKVLSEEEFRIVSEFAKKQVQEVKEQILEGNAEIKPYALAGKTACDYCPYHAVCGFEEKIEGYQYRKLDKLNAELALEKMREEVDTWE